MGKETVATVCLQERDAVRCMFCKHRSPMDLKAVRKEISRQGQRQEVEAEWT